MHKDVDIKTKQANNKILIVKNLSKYGLDYVMS
jgi:hypothetical protein